jgi:hypothetical protein
MRAGAERMNTTFLAGVLVGYLACLASLLVFAAFDRARDPSTTTPQRT